ncbi:MAG: 3-mercaptopyruvate sulfurtransferase [bacterium]
MTAMDFFCAPSHLYERLTAPNLKIVDGSWHMPNSGRDARKDYEQARIPGAVFFDIDATAEPNSDMPHMLPTESFFANAVSQLGISDTDDIIVYDSYGLFSAARLWWTFRVMGAKNVRLLEGGLPAWQKAGLPIESGAPVSRAGQFTAQRNDDLVRSLQDMLELCDNPDYLILDARPAERFSGHAPEPRPGLSSGHIPNAVNVPSTELVQEGKMVSPNTLQDIFTQAGLRPDTKVITSCGSGITAAILSLGLERIGHKNHSLFDGSWTQWASHDGAPIIKDQESL